MLTFSKNFSFLQPITHTHLSFLTDFNMSLRNLSTTTLALETTTETNILPEHPNWDALLSPLQDLSFSLNKTATDLSDLYPNMTSTIDAVNHSHGQICQSVIDETNLLLTTLLANAKHSSNTIAANLFTLTNTLYKLQQQDNSGEIKFFNSLLQDIRLSVKENLSLLESSSLKILSTLNQNAQLNMATIQQIKSALSNLLLMAKKFDHNFAFYSQEINSLVLSAKSDIVNSISNLKSSLEETLQNFKLELSSSFSNILKTLNSHECVIAQSPPVILALVSTLLVVLLAFMGSLFTILAKIYRVNILIVLY